MLTILDLGQDVISTEICKFLSANEIFDLSLTCKSMHSYLSSNDVYHQLYVRKFGTNNPLRVEDYAWQEIFKLRASRRLNLYTWGTTEGGRLGYRLSQVPNDMKSKNGRGVNSPFVVDNFNDSIITQILSGGFSFQVLVSGEIYSLGSGLNGYSWGISPPGPPQMDTSPVLDMIERRQAGESVNFTRFDTPRSPDNPNLRQPPENLDFPSFSLSQPTEGRFVSKLNLPLENAGLILERISSGRSHVLALDSEGNIFTWDTGTSDWTTAVRLKLPLAGKITEVKAGWNVSTCYSSNTGIAYWTKRENVTMDESREIDSTVKVELNIVPKLQNAKGFCAIDNLIVYIDSDGLLCSYCFDGPINRGSSNFLSNMNKWLRDHNLRSEKRTSFTKIMGNYRSITVFTDDGLVIIGNLDAQNEFQLEVIPELQNCGFTDVVVGDYHYLALTGDGELFSWGLELENVGCLGLGDLQAKGFPNLTHEGRSSRVKTPTRVPGPLEGGKWLAVAAGGWHSGGLFISK